MFHLWNLPNCANTHSSIYWKCSFQNQQKTNSAAFGTKALGANVGVFQKLLSKTGFFSASAGICEKTRSLMNYLMQPLVFADSNWLRFTFHIHLCIATRGLSPQQNIHETMNWRSHQPTQAHAVTTPIPTPPNTHYIAGTHYPPTCSHHPLRRTAAMFQPNNKNQCQHWEQLVGLENWEEQRQS